MKAAIVPEARDLRFDWITEHSQFLALRDQWDRLGSTTIETVFLTHLWLSAWLTELAPHAELHVLTAWDGERLVAALPLFGDPGVSRGRRWMFMGSGTLTPNHLDIIAEPSVREHALAEFATLLLAESARWDVLELNKLPADSETVNGLESAFAQAGLATACAVSAICPCCDLPATHEEFLAARKRRVRKKIRATQRWLEEQPGIRVLATAETEADAVRAFECLVRFHQARWKGKGYPGAFADPHVVRFHEDVVRAACAAGFLRMYTLSEGDEIIAVSYNFRVGPVVDGYLSSFDERWDAASPGYLLRAHVFEQCIEEGASCYDFLEGTERYKAAWTTGERQNVRLLAFNRTLAGRASQVRNAADGATVRLARRWVPQEARERVIKVLARRESSHASTDDADS